MINKKAKNLKINSHLQRQLCEKCQSFIQLTGAKVYLKLTLEMYVLQSLRGQFSVFHFFNPVFKNTKTRKIFITIRKSAPDNWTKIGYTFGPVKYRPNKRSRKLRIKSQIVRVTIFLCKNITD